MKKGVLKLDVHDDQHKAGALKAISGFGLHGIDTLGVDEKDQKITIVGTVDPVAVVGKLRKFFPDAQMVSFLPAKEEKKDDKKDSGGHKKDVGGDKKKEDGDKKATRSKCRNCGHQAPEVGPNSFYKVVNATRLESLSMPPMFTKHFSSVPTEFRLKTNTCCTWRVTVRQVDGRVILDQGWAAFAVIHKITKGCMVTFKLLTPDTLKVIVFNQDGIEMVNKCGKYDDAYAVNV